MADYDTMPFPELAKHERALWAQRQQAEAHLTIAKAGADDAAIAAAEQAEKEATNAWHACYAVGQRRASAMVQDAFGIDGPTLSTFL